MNAETAPVAADLWTKPVDLSQKSTCRLPVNYIHHCNLLLPKSWCSFYHATEDRRLSRPQAHTVYPTANSHPSKTGPAYHYTTVPSVIMLQMNGSRAVLTLKTVMDHGLMFTIHQTTNNRFQSSCFCILCSNKSPVYYCNNFITHQLMFIIFGRRALQEIDMHRGTALYIKAWSMFTVNSKNVKKLSGTSEKRWIVST